MQDISGSQQLGQHVSNMRVDHPKENEKIQENIKLKSTETEGESAKQQLNASIVNTQMELSLRSGNEPMAVLFKAAVEGINDVLNAKFGDNAIQNAYDSGLDVSPEATADRIVSMSTAFFSQYREQHADMSDEEAAKSFAEIIGGGIDKGFAEAKDILSGLKVFENDVEGGFDNTYTLVQEGLKAFVDSFSNADKESDINVNQ